MIAKALDDHAPVLDITRLVQYRQKRNRAAYLSHRKRTCAKYRLAKKPK